MDAKRTEIKTPYKFKPAFFFHCFTPFFDIGTNLGLRNFLFNYLNKNIHLKDGLKILDVGCGTCDDLLLLSKKYPHSKLYGIDADPQVIQLAKAKTKHIKVNLKTALAEKLPFKANSFDVVWSGLVLHHLPTKYKSIALKEMYRVLKPKGKLILITFTRPHNLILAKLVSIHNLIERTKAHYDGKIPQFIKQAGFKNLKDEKIIFNLSLIQAVK